MPREDDPSSQAAAVYDMMAEDYTDLFWDDRTDRNQTEQFLDLLPQDPRVLDAGCGPGNIARHLIADGCSVVGVDLSAELIEIATERVPEAEFQVMDIRELSFPRESFDGVYAAYSLMHVADEDVLAVLREFARVMRPGGVLFVAAKAGDGETYIEEPLADGEPCYFNFFDQEWLTDQIRTAGFEITDFTRKKPETEGELPNDKLIYIARIHNSELD